MLSIGVVGFCREKDRAQGWVDSREGWGYGACEDLRAAHEISRPLKITFRRCMSSEKVLQSTTEKELSFEVG